MQRGGAQALSSMFYLKYVNVREHVPAAAHFAAPQLVQQLAFERFFDRRNAGVVHDVVLFRFALVLRRVVLVDGVLVRQNVRASHAPNGTDHILNFLNFFAPIVRRFYVALPAKL